MPLNWLQADDEKTGLGCAYAVVGNAAVRFGGFSAEEKSFSSDTYLFSGDVSIGKWSVLEVTGSTPSGRARAAAVECDEATMLVWGGASFNDQLDSTSGMGASSSLNDAADGGIYLLDLPGKTWRKGNVVGWQPPPRQGHTAVRAGRRILIVGGRLQGTPKEADRNEENLRLDDARTLALDRHRGADGTEIWSWSTLAASPWTVVPGAVDEKVVEHHACVAVPSERAVYVCGGGCYKVEGFFGYKESTALLRLDLSPKGRGLPKRAWEQFVMGTLDAGSVVSSLRGNAGALETIFEHLLGMPIWKVASAMPHGPAHRRGCAMALVGERDLVVAGGSFRRGRNMHTDQKMAVYNTTIQDWLDQDDARISCAINQLSALQPAPQSAAIVRDTTTGAIAILGGGEVNFHKNAFVYAPESHFERD